jgi:hypothetical protein
VIEEDQLDESRARERCLSQARRTPQGPTGTCPRSTAMSGLWEAINTMTILSV